VKTLIAHLFVIFSLFFYGVSIQAHQVNTLYAELTQHKDTASSKKVTLDIYYDVSLSLEEWQGDEIPAPTREWLLFETQETYERIKKGAINYVSEHVKLQSPELLFQNSSLNYSVTFPDFEVAPPNFPKQRNGYAYTIVRVVWDLSDSFNTNEKLALIWRHSEQDLVLRIEVGQQEGVSYQQLAHEQSYAWQSLGDIATIDKSQNNQNSFYKAILSWFNLGFTHILPKGWDHLLFIAGLFFLARSKRELLTQSLLFTLTHSVVLVLMVFGVVLSIPSWIELAIALSIIYIGLEAYLVQSRKLTRLANWRPWIICFFGLVHGFAFAEILQAYFSQEQQVWLALIGFNLGIESAQIVIIVGLGLVSLLLLKSKVKAKIYSYACYAIAIMGIVWLIERII